MIFEILKYQKFVKIVGKCLTVSNICAKKTRAQFFANQQFANFVCGLLAIQAVGFLPVGRRRPLFFVDIT